jgi:AcrR family transcriptional regulator
MTSSRRIGATTSKTRAVLLTATEQLMLEEGYAAVSSRRVAARAGVKASLVHYYFPTLDDLFISVYRRRSEANLQRLVEDLQSDRPLHAIWEYANNPTGTALTSEFLALANQRKTIQAAAIPRVIVIEEALGMSAGHPEARALVERYLEHFEGPVHRSAGG